MSSENEAKNDRQVVTGVTSAVRDGSGVVVRNEVHGEVSGAVVQIAGDHYGDLRL